VIVTAADAVLLERSKGFFRGGFLSVDFLTGPLQTLLFLSVSLLADAAFVGLVVVLVAGALRWSRLHVEARIAAGFMIAVGALLAYDAASYEIFRFLGSAFDLRLVLDLVDGQLSEILAVSSGQLAAPLALFATGCAATAAVVALVHRRTTSAHRDGGSEPMLVPIVLAIVGAVTLGLAATSSDVLANGLLRKPSGQAFAGVLNLVTDVDGDGYGIVGRAADPGPFDGGVYPYAVDIPGNGVDEDGVGGDLPAGSRPFADTLPSGASWARRPDVVLFVLESFRADAEGARFDGRPVTPVLDALASRGVRVGAAYSHNGYTVQSRFHIYTGTLAGAPGSPTLVDDFKRQGYRVGYFSGQDESFGGAQFAIGFDRADVKSDARTDRARQYSTSSTPGSLAVPMSVVVEHVSAFLADAPPDQPIFLCVNFHDTHFPYTHAGIDTITSAERLPREDIVPAERERLWATYANTAANVDRAIGRVIDEVRAVRQQDPGVIVTSDHGESLFDEGFLGHGYGLNDAQTRVPFLVANLPLRLPDPMAQSELRPALLAALAAADRAGERPSVVPRGDAPVFQYLGNLSRPREIGFVRGARRVVFDFRNGRARIGTGAWAALTALPAGERAEVLDLIRYWERIQLARHQSWQRDDD
jgi:hypothetical protein